MLMMIMMMMMLTHYYDYDVDTDDENGEDFNDGDEVIIQKLEPQTSNGTNFGPTNVGLVQTSDTNKRRTRTNVGPVKTSNR